ncbi:MAG: hypothetical protein CVT49_13885 [candidate division Zixibacteria bacterium HGW-Zixibacteria-1]|nr:MAG: hypothetical protein CVT49_13885 [candidate division Zixibacteria bacterium HGW-Zixibacteria-1]
MSRVKFLNNQIGMVTFIALMVMLMLTIIGAAALKLADDELNIAGNEMSEMTSFYAAEAGLEMASASIQAQYVSTGNPPTTMPSGSNNINSSATVAYVTTDKGAAVQRTLTLGTLAGLHALVKSYRIQSIGTSLIDGSQIRLTQEFEAAMVPIFQFAVFYNNDLEIAPGPDMSIMGRIHTNGNLYLQAGATLWMDSYVSSSKNLYHGPKGNNPLSTGDIFIKDTDGNYQNMKNADASFLQSTNANWYDSASSRWNGRVQDAAFGHPELTLPLTNAGDAHKLIERSSGNPDSYENKANMKIIDGNVYSLVSSTWVNVTGLLPAGTVTQKTFFDGREGKNVNTTEINMSLLKSTSYYPGGGVIYASDHRAGTFNALRLVNGSDLGQPLSIYSENPIYVQGNFNNVNKQPVAIAGDAVTFLSNSWDDTKSTLTKDMRPASQTTVNASILTGNTNTTMTNYNGGLENLPRFLENWNTVRFIWRGSMINLWNSLQANGNWGGSYYTPPIRDWAYDNDLDDPGKLPPNTPCLRVFQRTSWKQEDVGYVTMNENLTADTTTLAP